MSLHPPHLRQLIIDTLRVLEPEVPYSTAATELLLLTAAVESNLGTYLWQLGTGPARGIYQMEPATMSDIFVNWLVYQEPTLLGKVNGFGSHNSHFELDARGNLPQQTVFARLHYRRVEAPLPEIAFHRGEVPPGAEEAPLLTVKSIHALAEYWKRYYNTPRGKGTVAGAMAAYRRYFNAKR